MEGDSIADAVVTATKTTSTTTTTTTTGGAESVDLGFNCSIVSSGPDGATHITDCSGFDEGLTSLMSNMDHLFLMIMGSMILLMQAGFAFLEAGSVRAKNTTNILIKNFADLCFGKSERKTSYFDFFSRGRRKK